MTRLGKRASDRTLVDALELTDLVEIARPSGSAYLDRAAPFALFLGGLSLCRTVYFSRIPDVVGDANFSTLAGTDDSEAVQDYIDEKGPGYHYIVDGRFKVGNLRFYDDTTIEALDWGQYDPVAASFPECGLLHAPGADFCIGNRTFKTNWRTAANGGPVLDNSLVENTRFVVRRLFIHGNRGSGSASNASAGGPSPKYTGVVNSYNTTGIFWITPIRFFGVDQVDLEDVSVYDPASFHAWFHYVYNVRINRFHCFDPWVYANRNTLTPTTLSESGRNTDGPHFTGPFENVEIDDVRGYTADDMVGLVPNDGNETFDEDFNDHLYTSPHYFTLYTGPARHVKVRRLRPDLALRWSSVFAGSAVALTSDSGDIGPHGFNVADDITYENCNGTVWQCAVQVGNLFQAGDIGRVRYKGIEMDYKAGCLPGMKFDNYIDQLSISDVVCRVPSNYTQVFPFTYVSSLFWFNAGEQFNVNISGVDMRDQSSVGFNMVYAAESTFNLFNLNNATWKRTNATPAGQVFYADAVVTMGAAALMGINTDGVKYIVYDDAPTWGSLVVSGIAHRTNGGSSNGLVHVANTRTLTKLVAGATDTAKLWTRAGTGTITTVEHDGTADATGP